MIKPYLRIYLVLILILIVLVFLVLFLSRSNQESKTKFNPQLPTPTISRQSTTNNQQSKISPTIPLIQPTSTGANEEIPQEVADYSAEIMALKKKLPWQEKNFFIEYDYSQDKFIVTLFEPKNQSRIDFEIWLKENYPLLTKDEFIIK